MTAPPWRILPICPVLFNGFFEGYMNHLLLMELGEGLQAITGFSNKSGRDKETDEEVEEQDPLATYWKKIRDKDAWLSDQNLLESYLRKKEQEEEKNKVKKKGRNKVNAFRKSGIQRFIDNLYVIYSGGDDVLMVGAWDIVMEFASIVQARFEAFTQGQATLSAGIIVVSPKFPVSRFADLVEKAEKKAKNTSKIKNRVCVFDLVLTWGEYRMARKLRDTLYFLVAKEVDPEPKALIHKIRKSMFGFEKIQEFVANKRTISFPRLWRLRYYLRGSKDANQDTIEKEIINFYERLFKQTLQGENLHNPALIAVAARWAEFMTKQINSKIQETD